MRADRVVRRQPGAQAHREQPPRADMSLAASLLIIAASVTIG